LGVSFIDFKYDGIALGNGSTKNFPQLMLQADRTLVSPQCQAQDRSHIASIAKTRLRLEYYNTAIVSFCCFQK
jgi:hypothetical protein